MERINRYTKEEAMKRAFRIGFEGEKNRHSCSQCTYNALADVFGIKNESFFRAVHPLEAGGGASSNTCGSFSAACAVIGYFLGRPYDYFMDGKEWDIKATILAYTLQEKFKYKLGSLKCGDILKTHLGFDMDWTNPEHIETYENRGGHSTLCPTVVGLTAAWTVDLLWSDVRKDPDLTDIPDLSEADDLIGSLGYAST
ncbi:MAG: C-GCAxxG-C-C family protein [Desulfobacterales bacterium]